jgi:heptosyltransferase-2
LDDEAKFRDNEKSYPQLIHEALGLAYRAHGYQLYPGPRERELAARVWLSQGVGNDEIVIGLNTGAGCVFANKSWRPSQFAQLARMARDRFGWRAALLGGPDEAPTNSALAAAYPDIVDTGSDHDELTFAAVVERCNVVVTGDTMAMHVAIARRVPVVALFGPTCSQEIDLFGRGSKVRTGLACSPCYRRTCDESPNCMDEIDIRRVLAEVERWVTVGAEVRSASLPIVEASR